MTNQPTDLKRSQRERDNPKLERLPPFSDEAEKGVLGCILLSPKDCMADCVRALTMGAEVFYNLRHQVLYETLIEMWDELEPIDVITVQQTLKDKGQMDMAGGLAYLSTLPDQVPSAANLQYYLDIIIEKYQARKLVQTCTSIVSRVYDNEGEFDELLDEVERDILQIGQERKREAMLPVKDLVNRAIAKIEQYHENKGALTGIGTGFIDLDKMTTGLHEGEMIIIAARPSVGKSAIVMNIADHVAIELKQAVGVFSLEMTADSLMLRMVCSRARVNMRNVRDGFLAERDFPKLTGAAGKLANCPLYIDDSSGLSILQLRARARTMWQSFGIKLFIIDYLQLLHATSRKIENRQQEVAEISGGIKALAKELKVPIIVCAQLNREVEKRGAGERPRLSDLRESGNLEADADLVGLLYRELKKGEDDDVQEYEQSAIPVKLFISKQRNGPTGDVDLTFLKEYTRFESAAKVSQEDMPGYQSPTSDP